MNRDIRKENINFDTITVSEASELVNLQNTYYGFSRNPEQWMWQWAEFQKENAVFTLLKDENKVIGTQGMMPISMCVGNKTVLSAKSESTLLLPEYRGGPHMSELYEYAVELCREKGVEFIWGFTEAVKAFKRFGFTIYKNMQWYERPGRNFKLGVSGTFRGPAPLWRKMIACSRYIVDYSTRIRRLPVPSVPKQSDYVVECNRIEEAMIKELYGRLRNKLPQLITLDYSEEYLRWRVRNNPVLRYREYQVFKGKKLTAYAIVVIFDGKAKISDLASEDPIATEILLATIINEYIGDVEKILFYTNSEDVLAQNTNKALQKLGFAGSVGGHFVLRDLSEGKYSESLNSMSNWHMSGLWTEGYAI